MKYFFVVFSLLKENVAQGIGSDFVAVDNDSYFPVRFVETFLLERLKKRMGWSTNLVSLVITNFIEVNKESFDVHAPDAE